MDQTFAHMSSKWSEQASSNVVDDLFLHEGLVAYACDQAKMYARLRVKFNTLWSGALDKARATLTASKASDLDNVQEQLEADVADLVEAQDLDEAEDRQLYDSAGDYNYDHD